MALQLRLFDTMSRSVRRLRPRRPGAVDFFSCGPSVYRRPHIGNYRTFLVQDLLQRHLEASGLRVRRAVNVTDIEDKALTEAAAQGRCVQDLTAANTYHFERECAALGIALPRPLTRASDSAAEAGALVVDLVARGHAYWHGRDAFFRPLSFPGFGKLARLDLRRWPKRPRRYRQDSYPGTPWNMGDFILWHGARPGCGDCWPSPAGLGRPSWNIQDPAIIAKYFGPQVDLFAGGSDALVRHHDYAIAVMEAASGRPLARHWMHAEHLLVDGKKMSKSVGNIVHLDDVVARGYRPAELRLLLLAGAHYRQRLNFTWARLAAIAGELRRARRQARALLTPRSAARAAAHGPVAAAEARRLVLALAPAVRARLDDDLDGPGAWRLLRDTLGTLTVLGLPANQRAPLRRALAAADRALAVLS